MTGEQPGFAKRLRDLHEAAGHPDLTAVAKRAGLHASSGNPARGRISDWMRDNGHRPHRWDRFLPVLKVLIGYAAEAGGFTAGNRELADEKRWKRWYDKAARPSRAGTESHRFDAYLARLRQRYARVEVPALRSDPVGDPPLQLRDVFVAQSIRMDPPTVELPHHLMHSLVTAGEIGRDDLPAGDDADSLDRFRQAYRRPARQVLQVLAEDPAQRIVLLGSPGAGKSTLARYVALALAETTDTDSDLAPLAGSLPLLVELRAYADPQWRTRTLLDLVDRLHHADGLDLPRGVLEGYLREGGRAVVIFDGLDELYNPRLRESVAREIAGFAACYPSALVVVTSRVIGFQRALLEREGFRTSMLQDFDRAQIDAFVTAWYRSALPGHPAEAAHLRDRLLEALDDSPEARELAGNPLVLSILALRGEHRDLPRDRRGVYEYAVSAFIAQWDPSRYLRDERIAEEADHLGERDRLKLLRRMALELLCRVALRMQDNPVGMAGNFLPDWELAAELDDYLRERCKLSPDRAKAVVRAMLEEFRARNSILSHFGAQVYGFVHRALLDYLAAAELLHRLTVERSLTVDALIHQVYGMHWADPAWHETLTLVAGMVGPGLVAGIVDHLLASDPLWFVRRAGSSSGEAPHHIVLAVRCLAEVRDPGELPVQCSAVVSAVIGLIEHMVAARASPTSPITRAVVETLPPVLGRLGARNSTIRQLYHDWYLVRGQFLNVMREGEDFVWFDVPPAARIGAALLRDNNEFRQSLVSQAVFGSTPAGREEALRALIQEWPDDPQVAGLLRELAETDPDGNVRSGSVQLFATLRSSDQSTVDWLRTCLADADRHLRRGALVALAADWRDDPDTFAVVRRFATGDRDHRVRLTAVNCLVVGWPGDPDAAAVVRECATCDPDLDLRTSAFDILVEGWRDDPQTVALLRAVAVDADSEEWVRAAAKRALVRCEARPTDSAAPPPAEDPRYTALKPLVVDRGADAKTPMLLYERALAHPEETVRVAAVRALATGWHTNPRTLPWLCELATRAGSEPVRQVALRAVGSAWPGNPDAAALLHSVANDTGESWAREEAVLALAAGWRHDPETLPLLRRLAASDNAELVRATAVRTLGTGWRDQSDTVALLRDWADNDPEPDVRSAAVQALVTGWRTPQTAAVLCRLAITDSDEYLRARVIYHLAAGWHADPEIGMLLQQIVTSRADTTSRRAAIRTLAGGWRDDPVTEERLRELAADDSNRDLQRVAVETLAERWPYDPEIQALADRFADEW